MNLRALALAVCALAFSVSASAQTPDLAVIARRVLEVCRADAEQCTGNDIPVAVSIGVAQWAREMGAYPDRLIAAADHALYDAKKAGRNGFATYDPAPPLAPEPETRGLETRGLPDMGLRQRA